MARITCKVCGGRTDEGTFCNKCGAAQDGSINPLAKQVDNDPLRAELPTQDNPPVADTPSAQGIGTSVNVGGARLYTSSEDHHPRSVIDLSGQEKPKPQLAMHAAPPPQSEPFSSTFDDCPWLWVERDRMIFCVENTNGVLRFKISAHMEGIEDVRMRLQFHGGNSTAVPWFKPKCLQSKEIKLNIPPMPPGAHPVDAYLQFIKEGKLLKFETTIELYVYPSNSAGKIAESIVFNITNDIKTGHASDVHLSQDAASAFGHFTKNGQAHALEDLLNLMNSELRAYRREELYDAGCEIRPAAPTPPPSEAITKRLSLMVGGRLLHLIADKRVTLGKNRDNRVVTRRFNQQGVADAQLCERISKFHCTLELDGEACVIQDGGRDEAGRMRPSTGGVSWQGVPVKGSLRIPVESLPKKASLGFVVGNVGYDFELAACAHPFDFGKCSSCSQQARHVCSNGRIPALLLRRTDQVPEHYLLVWACFDLGCVFPECAGMVVCYEQGAFSIRSSGTFGWLVPERHVGVVDVRPFAQYGL